MTHFNLIDIFNSCYFCNFFDNRSFVSFCFINMAPINENNQQKIYIFGLKILADVFSLNFTS